MNWYAKISVTTKKQDYEIYCLTRAEFIRKIRWIENWYGFGPRVKFFENNY